MNLSDRIQDALNAYHRDDADIDIMVGLLEECQRVINRADADFKTIASLTKDIDEGLSRLESRVKVQA